MAMAFTRRVYGWAGDVSRRSIIMLCSATGSAFKRYVHTP